MISSISPQGIDNYHSTTLYYSQSSSAYSSALRLYRNYWIIMILVLALFVHVRKQAYMYIRVYGSPASLVFCNLFSILVRTTNTQLDKVLPLVCLGTHIKWTNRNLRTHVQSCRMLTIYSVFVPEFIMLETMAKYGNVADRDVVYSVWRGVFLIFQSCSWVTVR